MWRDVDCDQTFGVVSGFIERREEQSSHRYFDLDYPDLLEHELVFPEKQE
jgi:hypothetical protein